MAIFATVIAILIDFAFAYIGGRIFDAIMGTQLLPFFLFAGLIGIGHSMTIEKENTTFGEKFFTAAVMVIIIPFLMIPYAIVGQILFPRMAQTFLDFSGYQGGLLSLAFWGCLLGMSIRLVKNMFIWAVFPDS